MYKIVVCSTAWVCFADGCVLVEKAVWLRFYDSNSHHFGSTVTQPVLFSRTLCWRWCKKVMARLAPKVLV